MDLYILLNKEITFIYWRIYLFN